MRLVLLKGARASDAIDMFERLGMHQWCRDLRTRIATMSCKLHGYFVDPIVDVDDENDRVEVVCERCVYERRAEAAR